MITSKVYTFDGNEDKILGSINWDGKTISIDPSDSKVLAGIVNYKLAIKGGTLTKKDGEKFVSSLYLQYRSYGLRCSKPEESKGEKQEKAVDTHANIHANVTGGDNRANITADLKDIDLPIIKQSEDWSCGAALVASVCRHFKIEPNTEAEAIRALGSSPTDGTGPDSISDVLIAHGLKVVSKDWMTLREIDKATRSGSPVLTPIQMYGFPKEYEDAESGHWVAVVGIQGDTVKIHDPVSGNIEMDQCEFLERWYDKDAEGVPYERFGMIVSRGNPKRSVEPVVEEKSLVRRPVIVPSVKSILKRVKAVNKGTCKRGERADLTGCTPASRVSSGKTEGQSIPTEDAKREDTEKVQKEYIDYAASQANETYTKMMVDTYKEHAAKASEHLDKLQESMVGIERNVNDLDRTYEDEVHKLELISYAWNIEQSMRPKLDKIKERWGVTEISPAIVQMNINLDDLLTREPVKTQEQVDALTKLVADKLNKNPSMTDLSIPDEVVAQGEKTDAALDALLKTKKERTEKAWGILKGASNTPMEHFEFQYEGLSPIVKLVVNHVEARLTGMLSKYHKNRLDTLVKMIPDGKTQRGYFSGWRHGNNGQMINLPQKGFSEAMVAHEFGHAMESDSTVHKRIMGFLYSRVGDEPAKSMNREIGGVNKKGEPFVVVKKGYDAYEVGRDDQFEKAFGINARYVGKVYRTDDSEVLSMGLEKLYDDPVEFARQDPEYFKFVVGIIDGSLL